MGLFSRSYDAVQVDEAVKNRIIDNRPEGLPIRVRPHPQNESVEGSRELFKNLTNTLDTSFFDMINTSSVSTFEIWYDDGKIQFFFFLKDDDTRERFLKQIGAFFPNADVKIVADHFPEIEEGEWIAGGRFHLKKHYFAPIRHPGGDSDMDFDPYQSITNDITAKAETRMVIQVAVRPVAQDWTSTLTKDVREYGEKIKKDDRVKTLKGLGGWEEQDVSTPGHLRKAGNDIIEQKGRQGFFVNLRMLAIGPTEQKAIDQCKSVGRIYSNTHEEVTRQTLKPIPQESGDMPEFLDDMLLRRGRNMSLPNNPISAFSKKINRFFQGTCETMIMTLPEVTALAHIPDESIKNNKVDWYRLSIDGVIPADAPEYENYHGGEPDDPRAKGGELAEAPRANLGGDDEFESQWENADEILDDSPASEAEEALEDSMDDPMEEFVE